MSIIDGVAVGRERHAALAVGRGADDTTFRLPPRVPGSRVALAAVVLHGTEAKFVPLAGKAELSVGRSADCDLRLEDPAVSRRHAMIFTEAPLRVRDLGSANGVHVRGVRLEPGQTVEIALGEVVDIAGIRVALTDADAAVAKTQDAQSDATRPRSAHGIVAESVEMRAAYRDVDRLAPTDISVLVLGETGAGKELVAEALHRCSRRAAGPFVAVNCATLPEALAEGELFGHERGAFTGAVTSRGGLFEMARGGTLFFDEIGELSAGLQAKLLRVLERREVRRLGSAITTAVDVRFVAATHRDLRADVAAGTFRRDLYFRIAGALIVVPPLRERPHDLEPLVRRFLAERRRDGRIDAGWFDVLRRYPFPGNVRELRNIVDHSVAVAGEAPLDVSHLPTWICETPLLGDAPRPEGTERGDERHAAHEVDRARIADDASLRGELHAIERERILRALSDCGGNQTRAATLLGMPRRTMLKRLDAYGVERPRKGRRATGTPGDDAP